MILKLCEQLQNEVDLSDKFNSSIIITNEQNEEIICIVPIAEFEKKITIRTINSP